MTALYILSARSYCGLGPGHVFFPHLLTLCVILLTHTPIATDCADKKCTCRHWLPSPAKPTPQPALRTSLGWAPCHQIKPNIAAMDLLIFLHCPASPLFLNKLPSSLLLRPVTSSSSPILHAFTLLVIPSDRPSAGVSQCNFTNSNGIISIRKRWVSVLVPLKAIILCLTSRNLQPGPSPSPVFIIVISCPLVSQQPHSFQYTAPPGILAWPLVLYCSQLTSFPSTLKPPAPNHSLPLSRAWLVIPSEYAWTNLVC